MYLSCVPFIMRRVHTGLWNEAAGPAFALMEESTHSALQAIPTSEIDMGEALNMVGRPRVQNQRAERIGRK